MTVLDTAKAQDSSLDIVESESFSLINLPGESLYGAAAETARAKGWTLIPQEREGRRLPSRIDGETLKWGQYIDTMPTPLEVRRWSIQARAANGAILLGPASGNIFALDIDVMDKMLSYEIQDLALAIMGGTEFRRQGQYPKMAMLYRVESAEELPPNRSWKFAGLGGDGLEIQGRGKMLTAVGRHHRTSEYFKWRGPQPTTHRPEDVPLTTLEKLEAFIDAVQALAPFEGSKSGLKNGPVEMSGDGVLDVSTDGWIVPPVKGGWKLNDDGLVVDGREDWLKSLCFGIVRYNADRVATATGSGYVDNPAGFAAAVKLAMEVAVDKCDLTRPIGGTDLRSAVVARLRGPIAKLLAGEIRYLPRVKSSDGKLREVRRGVRAAAKDPALWHLPPADQRRALDFISMSAPDPTKAADRALRTDRSETARAVALGVETALSAFFDEVYSAETMTKTLHLLKAPTGSGKTTRAVRYIARDPRTITGGALAGEDGEDAPGPILFLLPTYNNIDELRARAEVMNLDPAADDDALAAVAEERGIMSAEQALAEIADLRRDAEDAGLRTMVYKGKIAAGCAFADRVRALQDAGISSSGLCHAKVRGMDGETEERFCEHYSTCPAIAQRAEIARSHVVFMPHAFLNLAIPSELKNVRAVVADERIFPLAVHTTRFALRTLDRARREPKLTKAERESGIDPVELLQERDAACDIAKQALLEGADVADVFARHEDKGGAVVRTGLGIAKTAVRVCGSASSANVQIFPRMPDHAFTELVSRPTGTEVREEYRFWKLVVDRIEKLHEGTRTAGKNVPYQLLKHDGEDPMIRISWMTEPNWPEAPLLLLDASADREIVGKVFPDRHVVEHDIEADLNLRIVAVLDKRMATSTLVPHPEAGDIARAKAAAAVEVVRKVETALALGQHANGRVVHAMAKTLREHYCASYLSPGNVDYLHFGAERGLNFAEKHVAALITGRLELPVWIYDGLAAALAEDDDETLMLLDPHGTGCDDKGNAFKPCVGEVVVPLRDGSDVTIETALNPAGSWQRRIQIQYREEPIRQAVGRLRPVYREDTPTAYIMAQCVPEGLIVDDIVSADDLIPAYAPLLEAARHNDGVVDWSLAAATRADLAGPDALREQYESLPAKLRGNHTSLRYTTSSGGEHEALVPAHVADPIALLESQLIAAGIEIVERPEIVKQPVNARVEPAAERPQDAIETALGTRAERRQQETDGIDAARRMLDVRNAADGKMPRYTPGRGEYYAAADDKRSVMLSLVGLALMHRKLEVVEEMPPAETVDDDPREWAGML